MRKGVNGNFKYSLVAVVACGVWERAGEEEREALVKLSSSLGACLATFRSTAMPVFIFPFSGPHMRG